MLKRVSCFKKVNTRMLLLFICVFALMQTEAQTNYYVNSASGSDTNTGLSPSHAWKTLTHVGSLLFSPGDNILLKRGETFTNPLYFRSSGSASDPIKIGVYGEGDTKAVLNIKSDTVIYAVAFLSKQHLVLENMEITGNCRFGVGVRGGSHNTIQDCYIHHIAPGPWHGIVIGMETEYLKIFRNEISHCGLEGIYGSSKYIEVAYNNIHHINLEKTVGDCLQLNLVATEFHVHHNTFDRSMSAGGKGCVVCSDKSSVLNGIFEYNTVICAPNDNFGFSAPGKGSIIRYNTFKGSPSSQFAIKGQHLIHHNIIDTYQSAFDFSGDGNGYKVYNNVFKNISDYVVRVAGGRKRMVHVEFKNNISTSNSFRRLEGTTYDNSNNIYTRGTTTEPQSKIADPMFVSETDFHLQPGSPAIDAGVNVGLLKDFDGNTIGDATSIGIYENSGN